MIYLISATIRPDEYKKTQKYWENLSYNSFDILSKVIVDTQEHKMCLGMDYDCEVYGLKAGGITKPLTKLTKDLVRHINDDDIVVVMSDDFYPPKHWDKYLRDFYKNNVGALSVKIDGLNDGGRDSILSIPIIDGYTLKVLNGYIYHPAYYHLYSDNELFDNVKYLNLLHIDNNPLSPKFKHKHWTTNGRDIDNHDKVINSKSNVDKKTYNRRSDLPFCERIKDIPLLSILICSLNSRRPLLNKLLKTLNKQIINKNVELKICADDGQLNIPEKRNHLLNKSLGEYICFIDDDDLISDDYIDKIIKSTLTRPDVVGITGKFYLDNVYKKDFIHSIKYTDWVENDQFYERSPNHLNPIKRDYIFKIGGFDETITYGEDADFSKRIYKYLKNEILIEDPIYMYLFENNK